jgi:hypothetical protein
MSGTRRLPVLRSRNSQQEADQHIAVGLTGGSQPTRQSISARRYILRRAHQIASFQAELRLNEP